jgi:type III restriction enzyme
LHRYPFEALGTEVGFEDIDSFEGFIEEKVVVK